ncbi:MAG: hypothetical protein P8N41_03675, partial [Alphaproteobacteria bacterium]|nr:hypothetical protein [Alphaproteobacteria bacterium]
MLTAVQADLYLHHLEIQSNNPLGLAQFYSSVMSMQLNKVNNKQIICNGPSRKIIISKGNNRTLSHVGMACRSKNNLDRFKSFLVQNHVQIKEFNSEIYKTGSFSILDPDDNQICFGILSDNEKSSLDGINGPLQHVTFSSFNVEAFQEFYEKKLGFQVTDRVVKTNGTLATCFT